MGHSRRKIARGIYGISGRTAQAETDDPHQNSPEPRTESGREPLRRQFLASEAEANDHKANRQDDFAKEVQRNIADRRLIAKDRQLRNGIGGYIPMRQVDQPDQRRAGKATEELRGPKVATFDQLFEGLRPPA
jgi:hypothetical protein